jgi:F0F1-type ATP synthase gamma subunit
MLSKDHKLAMFLNKQPKEILRLKQSEVTGQYKKLQSEELQDLHFSPDSITVIKSLRTRYVRNVLSTGAVDKVHVLSVQKLAGKTMWETHTLIGA